ncbi:MAG TPA: sigma 54-interacting transcriptional regulator [Kofleriaceae bacterium]|nr:sigma 54-interacting transcriptional regulator [Kofleriaceae bacterium]
MVDDASTLMPAAPRSAARAGDVITLTIAYHPDVSRVGERARLEGNDLDISRSTPMFSAPGSREQRGLGDRGLSRNPIVKLVRSGEGVALELASTTPAQLDGRPLAGAGARAWQKLDQAALERGAVLEIADRVVLVVHLAAPDGERAPRCGLVGDSDSLERVRADISRVADLPVPVLVRGETGVGKELVAHALHASSPRASRQFLAINIAALPPTTAASELFGHARGAFTGATHDHDGMFARADGGTLFLDEVGETPFEIQPSLLRVLETSEVTPLGSARSRKVDVRLIAATDADLELQISESGFREALFHRLAGYQLLVPPLRDRRDDIGRLLVHFLRDELVSTGDADRLARQVDADLWLPSSLVARLVRHMWPGNVRQLRNAARQLAIANRGASEVRADSALERLLAATAPAPSSPVAAQARRDPSAITDDELIATLQSVGWSAAAAAARLGVSRSSLYLLIDRCPKIRKAKDLPDAEVRRVYDDCAGELDAAAQVLQVSRRALKLRWAELALAK